MAYFSGNFFHGTAIKIQSRLFLIPWLTKRKSSIICYTDGRRGYRSSPLIRYIPRKNVDTCLSPRCLEQQRIRPELNVMKFEISDESSSWKEEDIEGDLVAVTVTDEFSEDSSDRCCGIPSSRSWQDVQNSAIGLLASRAFTAVELQKKLQGKNFQNETINAVITDFQRRGLINDCLYAETYARSRWSSSSWGPHRIKQALLKKGISVADADKAIKLVFENSEGGEDQDSGIAMSKLSIDQLYVQASKQWQRSEGASHETRKSRIVRWLQYRGFNWSVIKYVLKKLESGGPS